MSVLTIFSTPKAFTNPHIATIQRNAILSWLQLGQDVEVILIGKEDGLAEFAEGLNLRLIPEVARNEKGTPLISSIFALAREHGHSSLLGYVNADIILMPDIVSTAQAIADWKKNFLMIGQRYDLALTEELDFSLGWTDYLRQQVRERGRTHPPRGSDYFIFPRYCYLELPDFAVGRVGWDNWMIYKAWQEHWAIVDATRSVFIIHQDHDYSHLPAKGVAFGAPEAGLNVELAGGKLNTNFTILDANYQFVQGGVRRARWNLGRILRKIELFLSGNKEPANKVTGFLYWRIYRWRIKTQKAKELNSLSRNV